ncbi:MAG: S41 family peptidase [Dehalococcoidia bacterium]|nr:S41 family peptidase [Dehalococcoidia bacterium]
MSQIPYVPLGRSRIVVLLSALLLVAAVSLSCNLLPGLPSPQSGTLTPDVYSSPPKDTPTEVKAIWEVWNTLVNEHVDKDKLDRQKLKEAAIKGMLDLVNDPHTSYLSPETYRLEASTFTGGFEGIGAEVTFRNNRPIIVAPMPNSPAKAAGIRPGDIILTIDGVSTEGKSLADAILRIRGRKGTSVTLEVRHLAETEPVAITITRGAISLQSVSSDVLAGNIGYVRIEAFNSNTNESLIGILKEMKAQGVVGLVLDLRDNPGGLVSSTVDVASQFLREGLVLYEVTGRGVRTNLEVKGNPLIPDTPLVVLVNRFSASGSEVLAGALQDQGRALLVGTRTFGKGSVNLLRGLSDGGGIYYSFARWYTPNGRLIEGDGLQPDVEVPGNPGPKGDPQVDKALELIKERLAVVAAP